VNDEFERTWKEAVVVFRYYPSIYLDGLRKTTKNLNLLSVCWIN
jgi:hypothetical protein